MIWFLIRIKNVTSKDMPGLKSSVSVRPTAPPLHCSTAPPSCQTPSRCSLSPVNRPRSLRRDCWAAPYLREDCRAVKELMHPPSTPLPPSTPPPSSTCHCSSSLLHFSQPRSSPPLVYVFRTFLSGLRSDRRLRW